MNDKDYQGTGIALTIENAPKFVSRLKKALRKNDIILQQTQCYELMAQMFGASNWHELHTLLKKDQTKEEEFNPVLLPKIKHSDTIIAKESYPFPRPPSPWGKAAVVFANANPNSNSNINSNLNDQSQTEMMAMLEDLERMFDDNDSIFESNNTINQFSPMELFNEHVDKDKLWKNRHPQLIKKLKDIECCYSADWIVYTDRLTLGLADTLIEGMKKISMADKKVLFTFRHKILAILTYLSFDYTYAFMEVLTKYPGLLPALITQNNSNPNDDFLVFETRIKDLIKAGGLDEVFPALHAEWIRNRYRDNTSESPFLRRAPNPPRNDNLKREIVTLIEDMNQAIRKAHRHDDEYDEF
jgi:hypothetical protein